MLDIPTILFLNTLMCAMVTAMLLITRLTLHPAATGAITWAVGDLCLYLANLSRLAQQGSPLAGPLADVLDTGMPEVVLPGAFVAASLWWHFRALRRVEGLRLAWYRVLLESLALAAAWVAVAWLGLGDASARLHLIAGMIGAMMLLTLVPTARLSRRFWGARIMLVVMAGTTAAMLLRTFVPGVFADNGVQQVMVRALVTQMVSSVLITLGFLTLLQELVRQQLQESSRTDTLTGLLNRRGLLGPLARDLERARRKQQPLSVALFDIDHFKKINDQHGHAAGDEALQCFAALLRQQCRAGDLLGRWGGEEFVLVMPETGLTVATQVAERIRLATRAAPMGTRALAVTVSGGVAEDTPPQPVDAAIDHLLHLADVRMYAAKQTRDAINATATDTREQG